MESESKFKWVVLLWRIPPLYHAFHSQSVTKYRLLLSIQNIIYNNNQIYILLDKCLDNITT